MARTTDIARVLTLASVPFGIPLECAETAILERNRRIECREARRIFWASFNVELVVESFLTEIAFFVGNPIIEPAMRLNNEFRHISLSPSKSFCLNATPAPRAFANAFAVMLG
jgi:hypothetical protein